MATTYTGSSSFQLSGTLRKSLDIGNAVLSVNYTDKHTTKDGVNAEQANMIWTDTITLSPGANGDLDLSGVLVNAFGDTIAFTCIKELWIKAKSTNGDTIVVTGSAVILDTDNTITIKPGGAFYMYDPSAGGYAVTNSSTDLINVSNSDGGASADYDIIIVGEV